MAASSSHQALYYAAARADLVERIAARLQATGVVSIIRADMWGIDDSRALTLEAHRTDGAGRVRHLVLSTTAMTSEAQNALLKLLEEPPRGVVFHCVFPPGMALLPTVRSRLVSVPLVNEVADTAFVDALIRLPIAEQLAEIETRLTQKDLAWVEGVKRGAFARLSTWIPTLPAPVAARLYETLSRLHTRGASNKMLLEELVLAVATHVKNR